MARSRKLSEPEARYSPLRGRKLSYAGPYTSRQPDGSDSDDGRNDAIENSKPPAVPQRRRTQSFLPVGIPTAKQKQKVSAHESVNEVSVKTATAAANSNTRTFRPAYM